MYGQLVVKVSHILEFNYQHTEKLQACFYNFCEMFQVFSIANCGNFFLLASPYFSSTSRSVTVKKGDTALLQCSVSGDKPINIVWLRSGKNTLNPSTNYKYEINTSSIALIYNVFVFRISVKQEATPDGVSAELQIRSVDASDNGPYFCRASNLYGNDQQLVQLQVQEPPLPPSVLEAAMISSRSVNLKWQPKTSSTGDITKYIVEFKEMDRMSKYLCIINIY